jgi:hypothetical protein
MAQPACECRVQGTVPAAGFGEQGFHGTTIGVPTDHQRLHAQAVHGEGQGGIDRGVPAVAADHVADVPQREQVSGPAAGDQVRVDAGVHAGHEQAVRILGFGQVLHQRTDLVREAPVVFVDAQ